MIIPFIVLFLLLFLFTWGIATSSCLSIALEVFLVVWIFRFIIPCCFYISVVVHSYDVCVPLSSSLASPSHYVLNAALLCNSVAADFIIYSVFPAIVLSILILVVRIFFHCLPLSRYFERTFYIFLFLSPWSYIIYFSTLHLLLLQK